MFEFLFGKKKTPEGGKKKTPEGGEVGLAPQPVEINPPPNAAKSRAEARYQRLLDGRKQGQKVPDEEIEKYRALAQGN